MILTWWEIEELEEHLNGRPDIWTADETYGMWLRTDGSDNPVLGLKFLGPNSTGPYRKFKVQCIPLGWSVEQCDEYLDRLCTKWTSYGFRTAVFSLLATDEGIKMDPKLAEAVAVAIAKIEQEPAPDPERLELPTQGEIWPDMAGCKMEPATVERTVRTTGLIGGGYVSIRYQGEMLRVRISMPSAHHEGFDHPLEGYVRPRYGNLALAAGDLFGHPLKVQHVPARDPMAPGEPLAELVQGELNV